MGSRRSNANSKQTAGCSAERSAMSSAPTCRGQTLLDGLGDNHAQRQTAAPGIRTQLREYVARNFECRRHRRFANRHRTSEHTRALQIPIRLPQRDAPLPFKDKAIDVRKLGRELNVRYVLEGSMQRGGNRLRVNVQLIDAETGNHLWAERFDKPIADLFDMQDEIVSRLANTLDAQLVEVEARRAEHSIHPDAMDLYFQGIAHLNKGVTLEHLTQARGFFERALALDPVNVEALVGTAIVDYSMGTNFFTDEQAASLAAAETALNKALSMAPQHAQAHMYLGVVYIFTFRAAQGIAECERALALDRNLANAHGWIGRGKFHLARAEETEAHIHEALRLSPRDTFAYRWMMVMGLAKFWLGADAEAVAWLRRSIEANRNFPFTHFFLAAVLASLGALDEARASVQAGLSLDAGFTIRRYREGAPRINPTYLAGRERICEGMRLAGVPEG